eukprot:tig00021275_g19880.t1
MDVDGSSHGEALHPFGADPGLDVGAETANCNLEEAFEPAPAGADRDAHEGMELPTSMQLALADEIDASQSTSPSQPQPQPAPEQPPAEAPRPASSSSHAAAAAAGPGAGQPFTLLLCKKARDAWGGPPEPVGASQKTGKYAEEVDLVLYAFREYRLQAPPGGRSWADESVCVRLAYAESAAEVPTPLMRFKNGYKVGPAGDSVVLAFREDGRTPEGFGFRLEIASYQLPRRRPTVFRLTVEAALDATPLAVYLVHVIKRPPQRKAALEARVGLGGGDDAGDAPRAGRAGARDGRCRRRAVRAKREPGAPSPVRVARKAGTGLEAARDGHSLPRPPPPHPPGPGEAEGGFEEDPEIDELATMFQGLTGFEREGAAGAARTGAAAPERDELGPDGDDVELLSRIPEPPRIAAAGQPSNWQPRIRSFAGSSLAPPYRHGSDAAREEATVFFRAALAAVRSCAQAAGVKHPVAAGDPPSPHVLRACEDLATALSSPELFDTPLFSTLDGRFRARAALEDLRLTGSTALARRPPRRRPARPAAPPNRPPPAPATGLTQAALCREDAELVAWHVWNIFEVCNGAWRWLRAPDLGPVDPAYMAALFDRANLLLKARPRPALGLPAHPHVARDALLSARATIWRARLIHAYENWQLPSGAGAEAAAELYFEAWSVLIRAGLTPSREEATILSDLTWVLTFVPAKWDLCGHFASKMYWFCGDAVEDRWSEAVAITNMGLEASLRGRARLAIRHFARGAELIEALSEGARPALNCCHEMTAHSCFHIGDFRGALKAGRLAAYALHTTHGYSYQDTDIWAEAQRTIWGIHNARQKPGVLSRVFTLNDFAIGIKWSLRVLNRVDICPKPRLTFLVAHSYYRVRPAPHPAPRPTRPSPDRRPRPSVQLGCVYHLLEKPAKAAPYLEKAAAHYAAYPAYFPPEGGRMRRLAELLATCRGALPAGGGEGGAGAGGGGGGGGGAGWGERHGSLSSSTESSEAEQLQRPAPRPGPGPGPADPASARPARRPPPSWSVPAAHAL